MAFASTKPGGARRAATARRLAPYALSLLVLAAPAPAFAAHEGHEGHQKAKAGGSLAGVLVAGNPPLTEAMVLEMADALGRATNSPLNATEVYRLRERAVSKWERSVGFQESIRAAHARLVAESERVSHFPPAAQPAAWRESIQRLRKEYDTAPESFLAEAVRRASDSATDPLVVAEPALWRNAGQAFFEMRDFFDDLGRGGRVKAPTVTQVLRGGQFVATEYQAASIEDKRFVRSSDRAWYVARTNWAALDETRRADVAKRAAALRARPGAVDAAGALTIASVRAFLDETGLAKPAADSYWNAALDAK